MAADGGSTRPGAHPAGPLWRPEEDAVIRAAWSPGKTVSAAAAEAYHRLPGRSFSATVGRASKILRIGHATRKRVSINSKRGNRLDLDRGRLLFPPAEMEGYERPRTRGDCFPGGCNEARPCPWVSCRHHLYLGVNHAGNIVLDHGNVEVGSLRDTCALDVADRRREDNFDGEDNFHATLVEVGAAIGVTRERARQIIDGALAKVLAVAGPEVVAAMLDAADAVDERTGDEAEALPPSLPAPVVRRHLPVVVDAPPPGRPVLDAEARALAATRAASLSPRTWLRRAAARRSP